MAGIIHSDAEYEAHPLAADTAEPSPDEYRALLGEIARDGLREPIVLFEGRVLEGRRRYRACIEQGVAPEFCELAEIADEDDPGAWALERSPRVLTVSEREILNEAEQTIDRGMAVFVEVGNALMAVRDQRLYRQTHSTFEAWCEERWEVTSRHANRTIAAANVVGLLNTETVPRTESVARELAALRDEPEKMKEAWEQVVARNGERPTAAQTQEVVAEIVGKPKPTPSAAAAAPSTPSAPPAAQPAAAPAGDGGGDDDDEPLTDPWDEDDGPTPPPARPEADPARAKANALHSAIRDLAPAPPEEVAKRLRAAGDPAACAYLTELASYL